MPRDKITKVFLYSELEPRAQERGDEFTEDGEMA